MNDAASPDTNRLPRFDVATAVPLAVAGLAHALWSVSDRLGYIGPLDKAAFGWAVVIPVDHVNGADTGYAWAIGRKHEAGSRAAIAAMRADVLAVLRQPSDGSAIAGKKWPPRYAARRIAWHALDHAWEIEDRADPA
ncbi:MAG: hypothetical protein ACYDAN_01980 [Candidatus Limnocylindrales bacterium]